MINNLITVLYMLIMLAIAIISNTILGVVIANKKEQFKWSKFLEGIGKAILIAFCMLLFCISLELVPVVLNRMGITIPSDIITVVEVVLITFTAYKKYATDVIDKFKTILNIEKEGN